MTRTEVYDLHEYSRLSITILDELDYYALDQDSNELEGIKNLVVVTQIDQIMLAILNLETSCHSKHSERILVLIGQHQSLRCKQVIHGSVTPRAEVIGCLRSMISDIEAMLNLYNPFSLCTFDHDSNEVLSIQNLYLETDLFLCATITNVNCP